MIELRNIRKAYAGHPALDDVSLALPTGQTTALIGPSGCGKSTLLRVMAGLIEPDAGALQVGGAPLERAGRVAHRQGLGYVIQDGGLFPHLTARDNVALVARQLRQPSDAIRERIAELADQLRLPARCLAQYPNELSGGQRQRVSLMRALFLDPPLLLMDEPLAALDPMIRAELQAELKSLFAQLAKTVVWVTHDLAEAAWFADDILLMQAGSVIQRGSIDALKRRPATEFVERFMSAQRQLHGGLE